VISFLIFEYLLGSKLALIWSLSGFLLGSFCVRANMENTVATDNYIIWIRIDIFATRIHNNVYNCSFCGTHRQCNHFLFLHLLSRQTAHSPNCAVCCVQIQTVFEAFFSFAFSAPHIVSRYIKFPHPFFSQVAALPVNSLSRCGYSLFGGAIGSVALLSGVLVLLPLIC
jgi:hypothetical protein